jgi:hypothetical protein
MGNVYGDVLEVVDPRTADRQEIFHYATSVAAGRLVASLNPLHRPQQEIERRPLNRVSHPERPSHRCCKNNRFHARIASTRRAEW